MGLHWVLQLDTYIQVILFFFHYRNNDAAASLPRSVPILNLNPWGTSSSSCHMTLISPCSSPCTDPFHPLPRPQSSHCTQPPTQLSQQSTPVIHPLDQPNTAIVLSFQNLVAYPNLFYTFIYSILWFLTFPPTSTALYV